jgi:hypothetical protein
MEWNKARLTLVTTNRRRQGRCLFDRIDKGGISMLLDNTGLNGMRSDLGHLDESSDKLGFVRWQWEYRRATYDLKMHDRVSGEDYFLRITTRAVEGKLENPEAILEVEAVYIGRATFPHGLDYESPIPQPILNAATQRTQELKQLLS